MVMTPLAISVDGISTLLGAAGGLLTIVFGFWIKRIYAKMKERKAEAEVEADGVDGAIKIKDAMSGIIDRLEEEIERAAERTKELQSLVIARDRLILKQRREIEDLKVENHRLGLALGQKGNSK